MPASKSRTGKQAKRTAAAETGTSMTEGVRRTQVVDNRHIAYTPAGVNLTHLTKWARFCILGYQATPNPQGEIYS
jgi:hypothetical protein